MKTAQIFAVTVLFVVSGLALHGARAQLGGVKRTDLMKQDLSVAGREVIQVRVDFPPGIAFPNHNHPGEELVYVIEGLIEYQLEGQPPVTLKAGEVLFIPAGKRHAARNIGSGGAAELATYIVERGKPLVEIVK